MISSDSAPQRKASAIASQAVFFLALMAAFIIGMISATGSRGNLDTSGERIGPAHYDRLDSGIGTSSGGALRGLIVEMPVQ